MARVLVVEDSPTQARYLEYLLRDAGHEVEVAVHGAAGLLAIRRQPPEIVVTDLHMPEMNGLELVAAVRAEYPGLPVILSTDFGSERLAVDALRAGASSYLPKRDLAREILSLLDEILAVSSSQKKQALFLDRMVRVEHRFSLENDTELVPQAVGHIEAMMRQMQLFDASVQMRVGVAVHEALVNAMVHGNLEVSSEMKAGDWQGYHDLIATRATTPPYSDRRVAITVRADRGPYLEIRVKDQGRGFDPSKLPDPTDPANLERASGRGLLLIRTFFDRVTHSASGNEIVMIKGQIGDE